MQLIDIGVNLTHPSLYNQLDEITLKAKNAGVIHQIITGTCLSSSQQASEIAQSNPSYFSSTAGCHPHDAKDFTKADEIILKELSNNPSVVAIGECGLDFNRNYSPQDIQKTVFELQIQLACSTKLPLFMHQRDAHQTFIEILSQYSCQYTKGVIHCFTGNRQQMKECLDIGLYIGITGWLCDERRGAELQEALKYLPLDRLMIETDSPFLLPRNIKPKPKSRTNTPDNLTWVVKQIASLLDMKEETVATIATDNTKEFFALT
ncbi:MAG: TatD DNase family protein [Enterobacterales bacterium]|jgi:TatD DNase family protein